MTSLRYFLVAFGVFSCAVACTQKPFQPVPPLFQRWVKEGSSPDMVKAALISCGFDNPYDGFNKYKEGVEKEFAWNDSAKAYICMEEKGFRNWILGHPICSDAGFKDLPACLNRRELNGINIPIDGNLKPLDLKE